MKQSLMTKINRLTNGLSLLFIFVFPINVYADGPQVTPNLM